MSRLATIARLAAFGIAVPESFMDAAHLTRVGLDLPAGALTRDELHDLGVTVPSADLIDVDDLVTLEAQLTALLTTA